MRLTLDRTGYSTCQYRDQNSEGMDRNHRNSRVLLVFLLVFL